MTWKKVPDREDGDVFTAGLWNNFLRDNLNEGVAVVLADVVLSASAGVIEFDNINQEFQHLELIAVVRSDAAAGITGSILRFNGDSSGSYDNQVMDGSGTTVNANQGFGDSGITSAILVPSSGGATLFGGSRLWIPDYRDTGKDQNVAAYSVAKVGTASGDMFVRSGAGFWRNGAAITKISLHSSPGSFVAGSRLTLAAYP